MNGQRQIMDNITEILTMIVEFTQRRQKFLIGNIKKMSSPGFAPMDLDADEFSDLLALALDEHLRNGWLVFCDGKRTKFSSRGAFEARASVDIYSERLLNKSLDRYLRHQIEKILENTFNQKLALELLSQKQKAITNYER